MNEYDSERLSSTLESIGYNKTDQYENADLVILNTCSIREKASERVYSELGRINQRKLYLQKNNKYMILAVTGCLPETEKELIFKRAPFVNISIGPQSYHLLKDMIIKVQKSLFFDKDKGVLLPKITHLNHLEFTTFEKFDFLNEERKQFNQVSAYISIQEGCDKFCTYCVVPNTRGREVSRSIQDILKEVDQVASLGAKEIVFLGQNVNAFHGTDSDKQKSSLAKLIEIVSKDERIHRIRYTTSHPKDMSDDLIEAHGKIKKLMPYLHLPVQSGSNNVLKRMNRKYTFESYVDIIDKIRRSRPEIVFSSDFIVAFPNESDNDFEDTIKLIERVKYQSQCFSFKYSKRPNTVASLIKDNLSEEIKTQRLQILQNALEMQRIEFNKSCLGKTLEVLFDNKQMRKENQIGGRSQFMQIVIADCKNEEEKNSLYGKVKNVQITKVLPNILIGDIIA
jgi:tRNA-2-methylthio-N6-dimethylallyladenosine synthase